MGERSPDTLLIGEPPIAVSLRRLSQAKRLTLRISQGEEKVYLTIPKRVSLRDATKFAVSKEGWIRDRLSAQPSALLPNPGHQMQLLGETITLAQGTGRTKLEDGVLYVSGNDTSYRKRLSVYLKHCAREALVSSCDRHAARAKRSYSKFTLRDTRTRWGSCSSTGGLMFSWRLVLAPFEVLDYVAAHEVAHLVHMNHSQDFWDCVENLMPEYKLHRNWLQQNGATLHAYRFS